MSFGKKLQRILEERNISVLELSNKTGISSNTLYAIIRRDSSNINIEILRKLADFLEITTDELIGHSLEASYAKDGSIIYASGAHDESGESYAIPKILQFLAGEISAEDSGYTKEELESILQYANFVRSQRKDEE